MLKKCITVYLVAALFLISAVPHVEGAFSPSEAIAALDGTRAADMERVRSVLEGKLVSQRLRDLGFSEDEIAARLSELGDEQLHALAQQLDELNVGGDAIGVAIGLVILVILVVLLLKLLDKEIIIR